MSNVKAYETDTFYFQYDNAVRPYIVKGNIHYHNSYEIYYLTEGSCKYFIDKKDGEWYGYLHYDNTPSTTLKGNIFKGPFHIPRFYMIMAVMDDTQSIIDFMK